MELNDFTAHYRTVNTSSGPLATIDIGTGPPVVFVHGVCMNSALWRRVIAAVHSEYRCVAIDLPCHGGSPARADHDYSLATLAHTVRDVIDELRLGQVHLVGNDTGGAVCQVFAAQDGERLATLTLTNCDTRGNIPPDPFVQIVKLAQAGRLARTATRWIDNTELARSNRNIGGGYRNPAYLTDEAIRSFLGPVMGSTKAAQEFEKFLVSSLREEDLVDAEPSLRALDVPTLIAWGRDDIYFGVEWAEWLANLIPGATAPVVIDNAGLYFPDECHNALIPLLRTHWSTHAHES